MFFLCRTSLFLDCKGRFPPSPPEDAAYCPDTQRTPLAKEETNGIWPAISLGHGTDYFTSPPKEGRKNPTASVGSEPAILGTRGQHANH
jgi:hypothetical protein